MKTREFIKAVEELGYKIFKNNMGGNITYFTIFNSEGYKLAFVRENKLFETSIYSDNIDEKLFNLIIEYAKTPIEDREEKEKRYYLRHKWISDETLTYLYFDKEYNSYILNLTVGRNSRKKEFTEEEIKGLKKTFNTDLKDFETIEVEE